MSEPERFRTHIPALVGAAIGTVLAATLGSLAGIAGTTAGLVGGSLISGCATWWIERGIRRGKDIATAKTQFTRRNGRNPGSYETVSLAAAVDDRARCRGVPYKAIGYTAAVIFGLALTTIIVIELGQGRSPAAIVQNRPIIGAPRAVTPVPEPAYTSTPTPTPTLAPATVPADTSTPTPAVTASPVQDSPSPVTPSPSPATTTPSPAAATAAPSPDTTTP
jgi:hypothetical protein